MIDRRDFLKTSAAIAAGDNNNTIALASARTLNCFKLFAGNNIISTPHKFKKSNTAYY